MITSVLEPETGSAGKIPRNSRRRVKCVYLTAAESEFRAAATILRSTRISLHHAATLEQAEFQLMRTKATVLMTEPQFTEGAWEDALEMLSYAYPRVALVLSADHADDRLWISALERGAFDVISKPFEREELRRILENAAARSREFTQGQASGSQIPPASGFSGPATGMRSAGSR
jgi:DNA-binding NtrC family response regulator